MAEPRKYRCLECQQIRQSYFRSGNVCLGCEEAPLRRIIQGLCE